MKNRLACFIIGFILWCLINWVPDLQHILVGIVVAGLVSYVTGDLLIIPPKYFGQPKRYLYFFRDYLPLFLKECLKANLDVAWRVIKPDPELNPGIVKVKTKLKTELGLTVLANTLTLIPGTLCVDLDQNEGFMYIHWINVKTKDIDQATEILITKFEKILIKIFE